MFLIAVVAAAAVGSAHAGTSPISAPPAISRPVSVPAPISRPLPAPQATAPVAQYPHYPLSQTFDPGLNRLLDCYERAQTFGLVNLSGYGIAPFGPQPCPELFFPPF